MKTFKTTASTLLLISLLCGCDEDSITSPNDRHEHTINGIDKNTLEANRFVYDMMKTFYLWNEEMPHLSYKAYDDTEEFFDELRVDQDYFSYISNSEAENNDFVSGISTSIGCFTTASYVDDTKENVCFIVRHVYKNTPAYEAGVKRGDIVFNINNQDLTPENYVKLWNTSGVYKTLRIDPETEESKEIVFRLIPTLITEDPATEFKVFDNGIAYLHYFNFYDEYNDKLTTIFKYFKEQGAKDLILDLRYNTGGYITAMDHLCSLIAPQSNVDNGDELIWYKYNKLLSDIEGYKRESNASKFKVGMTSLNLNRIVILTSGDTYSASEGTILGLSPYMEVVTIGKTTGGKNQSMIMLSPDMFTDENEERLYSTKIDNWLIAPIVATFYNSANETFVPLSGIKPDYEIDENDYLLWEFGSEKDPLTAAAIEYLTTGDVQPHSTLKNSVKREYWEVTKRFKGAIMPRR